jgi:hypothetical protein
MAAAAQEDRKTEAGVSSKQEAGERGAPAEKVPPAKPRGDLLPGLLAIALLATILWFLLALRILFRH